ncbi:MAG TPA: hypothetical protein VFT62_02205 [Mycobacteriales bacterium]|nr:hypothetical protein [Mycobacteriales bacterium]
MSETTNELNQSADATDPQLDIDDVEAHGLREVAAAASIGAAVIGAGGAAMAASHGAAPTVPRTPAIVQQATNDAHQLSQDAHQAASGLAKDAAGDSLSLSRQAVSDTQQITQPSVDLAGNVGHSLSTSVSGIRQEATTAAINEVNATARSASHTVGTVKGATINAKDVAATDANKAVHATTEATSSKTQGAFKQAGAVERSTIKVVGVTQNTVSRGWDMQLSILGAQANTGGSALQPGGTVSVVDAGGHTLATAKVSHGVCDLTLHLLGKSQSVTIHYSGDTHFSASSTNYQISVGL